MLAEFEDAIIALVKNATLGTKLRTVAGLPDLDGDNLVKRLAAEAPAVYVAPQPFAVKSGNALLRFGVACVARNSRGQEAARKGDGITIGLSQMLDGVMPLLDAHYAVTGVDFMSDAALYAAGLYVAVVTIEMRAGVQLPPALDAAALGEFVTFHADYDLPPFVSAGEHNKWLDEPADHSASAPELTATQTLQP